MTKSVLLLTALLVPATLCTAETYTCGKGAHALTKDSQYSASTAGFDLNTAPSSVTPAGCTSDKTFFFSATEPEGNYKVTVELGGPQASVTTVRAEARRLMLYKVSTEAGKYKRETFIVNLRRPDIPGDGMVHRKPREIRSLDWDDKLTLAFTGEQPSVKSIKIEPALKKTVTVYIAGDSTVVDQENEPWAAWGQMLPAFFNAHVAIANHAESGETIRSFETEKRFAKIASLIKPGDYLFMQFAHNDQKPGRGYVSPEMYTELLNKYIAMARSHGATPVLVTSMNRRTFDADGHITNTLAPYPATMRKVAEDEHTALIDLNAMSKTLYEAIGEPHSRELFVYAPANTYPGQTVALHDDTHFNSYGAYELARCVVLGIQQSDLPLKKDLRKPDVRFNPAQPDAVDAVSIPSTPFVDTEKPYER